MDQGAHFFRCDFQIHSPRDHSWKGKNCVSDEERKAYAANLIKACRDKGLGAIAMTDHHDMTFVKYVREAATDETDEEGEPIDERHRIVVFPGMELTLGVPCQALLIFDAEFPDDMFSLAMSALALEPNDDDEAKTAEVKRLDHIQSLKSLKDELDKRSYLRERYIILPNVSDGGSATLIRKGQAGKYAEMPCVGGYVDGSIGKLGDGNKNIIAGKAKDWGHKKIACFQTSDNRQEDHGRLGEHSTWVKWAKPTAEALRQACLAQESRISHEVPQMPSVSIGGVKVSNSAFLGPVDLELNAQYNALIGGRGTGKSTILEYLRWALCDQPPSIDDEDAPNYQLRRKRLVDQTLKPHGATVQVNFIVNGVPHYVRRNSEDGTLQIKIADDGLRECTEEEVRSLLPIQAYSQKQLSGVSVRIEELTRLITTPIRSQLVQAEIKIDEAGSRIRSTYAKWQRRKALDRMIQERELEASSLQRQAETLRESLTGLSEEDAKLLAQGSTYEAADQTVERWLSHVRSLSEDASGLARKAQKKRTQADKPPKTPEDENEILKAAYKQHQDLLEEAKKALDALEASAKEIILASEDGDPNSPWGKWKNRIDEFRVDYDAAVRRSSAHAEKMQKLREIEKQLSAHQRETGRLREELRGLEDAQKDYHDAREFLHTLTSERDALVDAECQKLTEDSGGTIQAGVERYSKATNLEERLRSALSGSGLRRDKFSGIARAITDAEDPKTRLETILAELELLADHDSERLGTEVFPETPALNSAGLSKGDKQKVASGLSPEDWLGVSLVPIESVPVFEYKAREGEYIAFGDASAGQQATALLNTLLNQAGPPLIIDQPEEDLDNPVMLEIVEQVWKAKQKRQLIFASHNANLVVNGDAELVAWCDYRTSGDQSGGKIFGEGAIDVPNVRNAIKNIMEGGEEAFNLRREKYGF